MVTALQNVTFSFNPKGRVEVKNWMKNMIRMKLLSRLAEAVWVAYPFSVAGGQP